MKNLLSEIQRDLRFAVRSLNKDRRFTLLAILALALGIGSVTVIFSAIYGVVIDTLPYPHFDRMVSFSIDPIGQAARSGREMLSIPEFLDYRKDNNVFSDMEAETGIPALHWTHDNQTTQWTDADVSANGYQFFGVKAHGPPHHSGGYSSRRAARLHDGLQGLEGPVQRRSEDCRQDI